MTANAGRRRGREVDGRRRDRRGGVAHHRLAQHLHAGARDLTRDRGLEVAAGEHEHVIRRHRGEGAIERGGEQCAAAARERQQLLGSLGSAPRPEALAATAGEHEHVSVGHRFRGAHQRPRATALSGANDASPSISSYTVS
jgi:hypothetical protein